MVLHMQPWLRRWSDETWPDTSRWSLLLSGEPFYVAALNGQIRAVLWHGIEQGVAGWWLMVTGVAPDAIRLHAGPLTPDMDDEALAAALDAAFDEANRLVEP